LPLAKMGLVLNRPHYMEEAKRQFMLHFKYLADPQTGLWFHGESRSLWAVDPSNFNQGWTFDGRHRFGKVRWGRWNSWITVATPDFIELLNPPPTDGLRLFLISTLAAQIDALVKCQDADSGFWHTILDDPTSYLEASASAGFAYGILKSLRMRLIPRDDRYVSASKKVC
jgi:unsaturated rhamnogalacturonyl hydrolase